ncbi:MAG: diphosphate--fructose-6-phosphate 1-phosphotransferase [Spirochaetales bacterium]|jgi:pyrophosphate--fructose-6-phosphate 1-phosphotransferase|nr:diphosphate--fructose-6-phosphate 1-phosphotransferase [Spirochaetales bacterium]
MEISALQGARYAYKPKLPPALLKPVSAIQTSLGKPTESAGDQEELKRIFPHTYGKPIAGLRAGRNPDASKKINVGVILSGGQAPGGHNVIAGLLDGIKKGNPGSKLLGFLAGPSGLLKNQALEITPKLIDQYRNTGGFDIIGSGRTKIETPDQFALALKNARERDLRALVVIGGDDSNTNAALLAEYFISRGSDIQVIGVPKTIDGDLKNEYIETSFGFDTAVKTYSELIGNISRDANSAKKYWHFIKLMGRAASHICLECALQTQPNVALISEEVEEKKQTLVKIVENICSVIALRASRGEDFGIVLVPEGLVEFIPEMKKLISTLSDLLAHQASTFAVLPGLDDQIRFVTENIEEESRAVFAGLPHGIKRQLLMDRDPHGNVQVSRIETEQLLTAMTEAKIKEMKDSGAFKGTYTTLSHFLGYEGRSAFPSNFDADYCYSLGYTAFLLIAGGLTGYISAVRNLAHPAKDWVAGGIPITMMMNLEQRHGSKKPVIKKALVELNGKPFKTFAAKRERWARDTSYLYPGAFQYYGPPEVADQPTKTIILERGSAKVPAPRAGSSATAEKKPAAKKSSAKKPAGKKAAVKKSAKKPAKTVKKPAGKKKTVVTKAKK